MGDLRRRLIVSLVAVLLTVGLGSFGYYVIGDGRWPLSECIYMTLVIVTTLGLESPPGWETTPGAHLFTSILLLTGIGTFLYFVSTLTAFILENDLAETLRVKRMLKKIHNLRDHVIVCGVGRTGRYVVDEMLESGTEFVVVEHDLEKIEALQPDDVKQRFPYVVGDATDDEVLERAGVVHARALISALTDDRDNLFTVISARQANATMRIVSRSVGTRASQKLRKAGADAVVATTYLGGTRLASEVLRPHVTEFLEEMLREKHINLRIEEVVVPASSPYAGMTLREAPVRGRTGALLLAIRHFEGAEWTYSPGPDTKLSAGSTLIVLVPLDQLEALRAGVAKGFDEA